MPRNITKLKHRFPLRQIRQIPRFLSQTWPLIALTTIIVVLCFLNYEPNTFFIGWDNLPAEFNPKVNFQRTIFTVWQEYQSLGLLGGMGHAADFIRQVFILLLTSINVPLSLIRYLSTFYPLFIGPLGVYFFLDQQILKNKFDSRTTQFASFFGGLFYLLNLGTMQTFYTPFETFIYFYGYFPWLLYVVFLYLKRPNRANFIKLFILSLLATPSFYIETLFVIFGLSLVPVYISYFLSFKHKTRSLAQIFISAFAIITANLFWLLPVILYTLTQAHYGVTSKINTISTPETFSRNLEFGNIPSLALLKGFWFNFVDLTGGTNKFDYLLTVWRNHLANPTVSFIGYLLFGVTLTGIYYGFRKKLPHYSSMFSIFAVCVFFLLGGGMLLASKIPLISEFFRSPFTKFSTPLIFTFAYFFSIGTIFLLDLFTYLHSRLTYFITLFTVAFCIILFMSPAFSGQFTSPSMRRQIPPEYFELFKFFQTQDPATRIANFPQNNFWGWLYYDWGYRGSGFLWYGIKQPILDRAFDVWNKSSQDYYENVSSALYSDDFQRFDKLMDNYAVNWILIDTHVIAPDGQSDLHNKQLKKWLDSSGKYSLVEDINDSLLVYKNNIGKVTNFISVTPQSTEYKPFDSLNLRPNRDWKLESDRIVLPSVVLNGTKDYRLNIPSLSATENLLPVSVSYQKLSTGITLKLDPAPPLITSNQDLIGLNIKSTYIPISLNPNISSLILQLNDQYYELQIPAEIGNFTNYLPLVTLYLPSEKSFTVKVYDGSFNNQMDITNALKQATPYQCFTDKANRKIEKIVTQNGISLLGTDVVGCLSTPLPQFTNDGVISYSFTFSSPTYTPANSSVTNLDLGALDISQPQETKPAPNRIRQFAAVTSQPQKFNLILEANDTKTIQQVDYQDINLFFHPVIFSVNARLNNIPSQSVTLTEANNRLQINLPVIDSKLDVSQTPDSNQLFPEPRNCDQFNNGKYTKTSTNDGFLYQSENAISCDYLDLRQMPHTVNYFLTFDYRYQTGLPMLVCLENHTTNRCDVYERLVGSKEPQSLIQPIANSGEDAGYTLHLFDQSIGHQVSSSLIKSFSIHPVPLNFLRNISISHDSPGFTAPSLLTTTHPAEFLYTVVINSQNDSLLNLYQTYSPYWFAIKVPSAQLKGNLLAYVIKIPFFYLNQPKL
ncbi:MAG TPA: hypothetical protein VF837_05290, partial [Patescibacteria group bacterium]